jgi:hypothetical protein
VKLVQRIANAVKNIVLVLFIGSYPFS